MAAPKRVWRKAVIGILLMLNSRLLGRIALGLSEKRVLKAHNQFARKIIDSSQPVNPLRKSSPKPQIDLVMVCSSKDFDTAPLAAESAVLTSENPVSRIRVITPDTATRDAAALVSGAECIPESTVLPTSILDAVNRHHPRGRRGWILQQTLGLWAARQSESAGVLVLDSDTVLLRRRTFLDAQRRQLVLFSEEYVNAYEEHCEAVWGPRRHLSGISFVTHYQLMQPWVLREMFPTEASMVRWVVLGNTELKSPIADYHSYGRWLTDNYPELAVYGRWRNKALKRSFDPSVAPQRIVQGLQSRHPHRLSVSFHSYLATRS